MNNASVGKIDAQTDYRLLLYYKGDISALTLFAQQINGSVCFPGSVARPIQHAGRGRSRTRKSLHASIRHDQAD